MNYPRSSLSLTAPPADQYDADYFTYPGLSEAVRYSYSEQYSTIEGNLEQYGDSFWKALSQESLYRYLPVVSLKIQEAVSYDEQKHWSDQYSLVTSCIFGSPEASEARRLAAGSLDEFERVASDLNLPESDFDNLFSVYRAVSRYDKSSLQDAALLPLISQILHSRYRDVYQPIDELQSGQLLNPEQTRELFQDMLARLSVHNKKWSTWTAVTNDSAQMSVSPRRRRVNIGQYMPGLSVSRVKGLFTHEVLVHAARSVQGSVYDRSLAYGLPGYSEAEEGLGVLMEASIEGKMPYRIVDRYIDIALALGILDYPPMSRSELFKVVRMRTQLRRQAEGSELDSKALDRIVWQHVNRIYKGTLGNEVIGVNTRDVIYYHGYRKMYEYLSRYLDRDLAQAIRFVLSGKMNPVDQEHRAYIHKLKFNIGT